MPEQICPQCGHEAAVHWPKHERTTSACAPCLDALNVTERTWGRGAGICCFPAAEIERIRAADRSALDAARES